MKHSFTLDFPPRAKGRPQFNRKTGMAYTPKTTREYEAKVAKAYDGPMFEGPVGMTLRVTKKKTEVTIFDFAEGVDGPKGDLDNYAKAIGDGLNGIAYADDSQVVWLLAVKGERCEVPT